MAVTALEMGTNTPYSAGPVLSQVTQDMSTGRLGTICAMWTLSAVSVPITRISVRPVASGLYSVPSNRLRMSSITSSRETFASGWKQSG